MFKNWIIALMALLTLGGVAHAKKKDALIPGVKIVAPTPPVTAEDTLVLQLSTGGTVRIQLRPDRAPNHIERIKLLTRSGFYDGISFHRVIEGFMAQAGDPQGTGQGGSPLPDLNAEFNDLPHLRGTLSMARTSEPNSANSQFFICFQPVMKLDNKYTVLGRVLSGMDYVDAIQRGEPPAAPSRIVRAWIEADGPNAPRVPLAMPAAPVVTETVEAPAAP